MLKLYSDIHKYIEFKHLLRQDFGSNKNHYMKIFSFADSALETLTVKLYVKILNTLYNSRSIIICFLCQ